MTIHGPASLPITRAYWSIRADRQAANASLGPSILGWGWGLSVFEWLTIQAPAGQAEVVTVHRSDGALDVFREVAPDSLSYVSQEGKRESLDLVPATTTTPKSYRLTQEDGVVRVFESSKLRYVEPPGAPSLRHELCYADSSLSTFPATPSCQCGAAFSSIAGPPVPCEVKPSAGPALFLSWMKTASGNPVVKSLNWDSSTGEEAAVYEYDPATGDLLRAKLAKSPGVYEVTQYAYDSSHHLTTVTDGANVVSESLTWLNGKAQTLTTPTQAFTMTYSSLQTSSSEANSATSYTLSFASKSEPTTVGTGCACNTNVAAYGWERKSLKSIKFADGSFTSFLLNPQGDEVRVVTGDTDSDASTVPPGAIAEDRTYHPAFRALTSVTRPGLSLNSSGKAYVIFDFQDPSLSPAPTNPFCGTSACATPANFNMANVGGLVRREIRKGSTLTTDGAFNTEAVTYVRDFAYDSTGRLKSVTTEGTGESTSFEYFPSSAVARQAGRLRFVRRAINASGATLDTEFVDYDNRGNPLQVVDESGQTWNFTYELHRLKSAQTPGVGAPTLFQYGLDGQLDLVTLPQGNVLKYTYNAKRQLTGIARMATTSATTAFERVQLDLDAARGLVLTEHSFRTPAGASEVEYRRVGFVYDSMGRRTATKVFRGSLTAPDFFTVRQFDVLGNVAKTSDANHATSTTDVSHFNTEFAYDPTGFLKTVKRLVSGTLHTDVALAPDAHGNVSTVTDGESRVTTYGYDDFDRVISVDGPTTLRFAYDASHRLVRRTQDIRPYEDTWVPNLAHHYDLAGRLTGIDFGGAALPAVSSPTTLDHPETLLYDEADGTVTKCIGGTQVTLRNSRGRLSTHSRIDFRSLVGPAGPDIVDRPIDIKYGYDAAGRIAVEARRVGVAEQCWHVIERSYTDNGRLKSITYPSGRVVAYVYPSTPADVDKPTSITSTLPGGSAVTVASSIEYEGEQPVKWISANGVVTTVRNNFDGTEAGRDAKYGVTAYVNDSATGRDGNGNLTILVNSAGTSRTQTFTYTDRDELASAVLTGTGTYGNLGYTYDNAGDRMTATRDGVTTTYSYSGFRPDKWTIGSTVTREYQYDSVTPYGSTPVTSSRPRFVRDPFSTTEQLPNSLRFILSYYRDGLLVFNGGDVVGYDALRRRASLGVPVNSIYAQEFWDGSGRLLSEIGFNSLAAPNPRPVFDYVYLDAERIALLTGTWDATGVGLSPLNVSGPALVDGSTYALHGNHIGATVSATNSTRSVSYSAIYEPFGRAVSSGLGIRTRLPGQYESWAPVVADSFTTFHNWNRDYDPSAGTYLGPEPFLQVPEYVRSLASWGMAAPSYSYAGNNPLQFVDPEGLDIRAINWSAQLTLNLYTPIFLRDPVMGGQFARLLMDPNNVAYLNVASPGGLVEHGGGLTSARSPRSSGRGFATSSTVCQSDAEAFHEKYGTGRPPLDFHVSTFDGLVAHELGEAFDNLYGTEGTALRWENARRAMQGVPARTGHSTPTHPFAPQRQ